jgi:hypothetical protein
MSGVKPPTKLDLGLQDAAFVIRADGKLELFLPQRADEEALPEDEVTLAAFAAKFRDERLRAFLAELLGKPLH